MSRSSSGSCFFGFGAWEVEPPVALLGPLVGQECWVDGEAGVCGEFPDWTVRTPSPACGRAEFVVPVRGSVGAGTGTVSSACGVDDGAA